VVYGRSCRRSRRDRLAGKDFPGLGYYQRSMTHFADKLIAPACLGAFVLASACSQSKVPTKTDSESKPAVAAADMENAAVAAKAMRTFNNEKLQVACGSCIFEMKDVEGCPWAAEIDGKHYLIAGKLPTEDEHDSHGDEGMCTMARHAMVTGELRGDKLVVSQMNLVPVSADAHAPGEHGHGHGDGEKHGHEHGEAAPPAG